MCIWHLDAHTKKCSRTSPVLSVLMVFFKQLVNSVCMSFETVWKLIMQFSGTWKILEKRSVSNWLWKGLAFLLGKILKYPEMDMT